MSLFVFGTTRFCGAVSCILPRLNRHCRAARRLRDCIPTTSKFRSQNRAASSSMTLDLRRLRALRSIVQRSHAGEHAVHGPIHLWLGSIAFG